MPAALSQPTPHRLPTEILLLVFTEFLSSSGQHEDLPSDDGVRTPPCPWPDVYDFRTGPWILSQVCSRWRHLSLHTPKMWSNFHIGTPTASVTRSDVLNTWLQRSGSHPLSFRVEAYELCRVPNAIQIVAVLHRTMDRWYSLEIVNSAIRLWNLLYTLTYSTYDGVIPFKSLQSLCFICHDSGSAYLDVDDVELHMSVYSLFSGARKLESLINLDYFHIGRIDLPWSQITRYMGSARSAAADHFRVLCLCPNLVECTLSLTVIGGSFDQGNFSIPIELSKLRTWRTQWRDCDTYPQDQHPSILENANLPSLEDLSIHAFEREDRPPFNVFTSIISSSACSLRSLDISGTIEAYTAEQLLLAAKTITRLRMSLHTPIHMVVMTLLAAPREQALLPLLETLEFSLSENSDVRELDLAALAIVVRSRRASRSGACPIKKLRIVTDVRSNLIPETIGIQAFPPPIEVLQDEGLDVAVIRYKESDLR